MNFNIKGETIIRTVETKRFILKLVQKENVDKIFKILSNPHVIENLNMDIHNKIEDTIDLLNDYYNGLQRGEKFPYEILDKTTGEFIGVFLIKLDFFDEDCYEFTIYLDEVYWGKGVYTEILPYMVKVAFEDIGTENFRGFVMEKNIASKKVLEKCGFKLEKIFNVNGIQGKIYSYLKINNNK